MSLISRLSEKSWQTPGVSGPANPADGRPPAARVGLYAFLGVATVVFGLLSMAYLMRMGLHGTGHSAMGREAMGQGSTYDWQAMPKPALLWINTGVLAASSLAWEGARRLARTGDGAEMRMAAIMGSALGALFLFGQMALWEQYRFAGYFLASNPANSFFYLLTGLHGLHLVGGLVAAVRTFGHLAEGGGGPEARLNIQLCAVYWHFLLLVWLVLFGLLLST